MAALPRDGSEGAERERGVPPPHEGWRRTGDGGAPGGGRCARVTLSLHKKGRRDRSPAEPDPGAETARGDR